MVSVRREALKPPIKGRLCLEKQVERPELIRRLTAASFLTGEFRLRSGSVSSFYWDKYRFESDPALLGVIVDELKALLPDSWDKLAGLELGGIPLATALSLKTGKPCLYVRKVAKSHGTCNLVEGGFQAGETAVVVEDVITTAGQVCASVQEMRKLGLVVNDVVCVIDRQEGGTENLKAIGCSLASVFTLGELEDHRQGFKSQGGKGHFSKQGVGGKQQ